MTAALSFLVVTDKYETIRLVMSCLRAQTARDRIEVVIVIPEAQSHEIPLEALDVFHSVRVVPVASVRPMPGARAAGVRACSAPVIFIGETHSFPHPEFAEAIIEAHDGPWDVVVPGLSNANPRSPRSWSAFVLDYGYWMTGLEPSVIVNGPTWNASYKREVLLELGDMLDSALSSGDELPLELKARNRTVYFDPRARIDHTNVELGGWADERFLSGRVVGANRGRRWSRARRGAYFLASPLIPFVLLYRARDAVSLLLRQRSMPRGSLTAIVAGVIVRTVGEAMGYVGGITAAEETRMEEYELHKLRNVAHLGGVVEAHT